MAHRVTGRAAQQILDHREADQAVVGHADWYAGNTAVTDGKLVGTFVRDYEEVRRAAGRSG